MKTLNHLRLSVLVCAALAVWGLACFLVNGPAIFVYVGLQAITSGVFAYAFYRKELSLALSRQAAEVEGTAPRPTIVPKKGNKNSGTQTVTHSQASA